MSGLKYLDIACSNLTYLQNTYPAEQYTKVITSLTHELPLDDKNALVQIVDTYRPKTPYSLKEAARYYVAAFSLAELCAASPTGHLKRSYEDNIAVDV